MGRFTQVKRRCTVAAQFGLSPPQPSGWSVAALSATSIRATRTEGFPSGIGYWQIRYRESPSGPWSEPGATTDSTKDVTGLTAETTYDVQARWSDGTSGRSEWSPTKQVTTPA